MSVVLSLTIPLLLAAPGDCYLVSNTRIVVIPSCDFSPGAIRALRQATADQARTDDRPQPPGALPRASASSRDARPGRRGRGESELQRRLAGAERQMRLAESQRAAAERQRAAAVRELAALRRELASVRASFAGVRNAGR